MCIAADFERVFEIGPVFRAEDSNTHRHMTEFMGLDMEMAFEDDYHEVLNILQDMLIFIFTEIKTRYARELKTINVQYPFEDFLIPTQNVCLTFKEGIEMLRQDGAEIGDYDDLRQVR